MASSGHLFIISIHTTRKVVTISLMNQKGPLSDFNPHHPQGGDTDTWGHLHAPDISIHTTRKVVTLLLLVASSSM